MNDLLIALHNARLNNLCTKYGCTTCGAYEFRSLIKKIPKDQIIKNLIELGL